MPPQRHNQPTPTLTPIDTAAIMEMLTKMASDSKTDIIAMEARIKQDIRDITEQVENRLTIAMEGKFSYVQSDITTLNKTTMEQAAKLEKLSESQTRTEAELVKTRGELTNAQNEENADLYNRQAYIHNISKLFPSLAEAWQIRKPGLREDVTNFLEIQFEQDDPPFEQGVAEPLNPLNVPSRYKNTAIRIIDVAFFKPKANTAKEGDVLPCIITFNHVTTARRFRQLYQKTHPGNISQASFRGNPEFNQVSAKVKRAVYALKFHNFIGAWDFRPQVNKKTCSVSYTLHIRPHVRFQNNVWINKLQTILGGTAKDSDCSNFFTQLLTNPVYNQSAASIKAVNDTFLAPKTGVTTRSSDKNSSS